MDWHGDRQAALWASLCKVRDVYLKWLQSWVKRLSVIWLSFHCLGLLTVLLSLSQPPHCPPFTISVSPLSSCHCLSHLTVFLSLSKSSDCSFSVSVIWLSSCLSHLTVLLSQSANCPITGRAWGRVINPFCSPYPHLKDSIELLKFSSISFSTECIACGQKNVCFKYTTSVDIQKRAIKS